MAARFDIFISYAASDQWQWVLSLAENLHQRGFEVFLDAWELGPGDVLVHELERGILESRHGVLVLTKSYFERPFVRAEYAAILQRTIEGRQRVIPVLVDDVEVPPLLVGRSWVDFRGTDAAGYDEQLGMLVRALQGKPAKDRPLRTGEWAAPPETRYRPEGALRRTLRIGRERVSLVADGGEETAHKPRPRDHVLEERIYELDRARHRRLSAGEALPKSRAAEPMAAEGSLHGACLAAGAALTRTFLDGAAGDALRAAIEAAERLNTPIDLGLEVVEERLRRLPWETLRIPRPDGTPGEPLALHSRVNLYRTAPNDGSTPAIAVPGPLRILAAIGSPETGGGELLDYEKELGGILDAVEPARAAGKAHVRILHRGTVPAIRDALEAERYHVLHLSCHAGPGVLILETDEGDAETVTAKRLLQEALPPNRGVPLVVLAGSGTAQDILVRGANDHDPGTGKPLTEEEVLPGLAAELLEFGVPAVLGMNAPVSDHYATELAGRFYRALATQADPEPVRALADARREVEATRLEEDPDSLAFAAEWATPVLYVRGAPELLYDPAEPFHEVRHASVARLAPGVVVRKIGDVVGRRREKRLILRTLWGDRDAGIVIHGLGGVGKSTLAADVLNRLVADGRVVVSILGETNPEQVIEAVGRELLYLVHSSGAPADHPLRRLATDLRRPDVEWPDRFDLLEQHLLGQLPLVLFLDSFEDNLEKLDGDRERELTHSGLAMLLARWLEGPSKSRIVVASRHPFILPRRAHRHLLALHLGPMSWAETRKLIWRLPALDRLPAANQRLAYEAVGGHPRALEYLDALLRGGRSRFADVTIRLEEALKNAGIESPEEWMRNQVEGDLDRARAETITLVAADALLADLLDLLKPMVLARRLLMGTSVYRLPVDVTALAWQVSEEVEPEMHPDQKREWKALQERIRQLERELEARGEHPERENLGLSPREWERFDDLARCALAPPLKVPDGIDEAQERLERLGLLAPVPAEEATLYQVHRWTAAALATEANPGELQEAHRRAARFWRWRVHTIPQSREADLDQLLEARYHHHAAGEIEQAVQVTASICSQLDTWGAYGREEQLCREVLDWIPEQSREAAMFLHQLGIVAQKRGLPEEALDWYRKSLAIAEELGDRAEMARSYHQLGMVAQDRGSYEEALEWYRKSLTVEEGLGDRSGVANSYHQLGIVAQRGGDNAQALEWYRKSLAIDEELGNRVGMAASYHQLGLVEQESGNHDQALDWYRRALAIKEELGDRAGLASSYHQLGRVAQEQGDHDTALGWFRRALALMEELGDQAGMATSYGQIGVLLTETGQVEEAISWTLRSLAIRQSLRIPEVRIDLHWLGRQRRLLEEELFRKSLREHLDDESTAIVLRTLDEMTASSDLTERNGPELSR